MSALALDNEHLTAGSVEVFETQSEDLATT